MKFEDSIDVHTELLQLQSKPNRTSEDKNRLRFLRRICGAEKQATLGLSETEVGLAKGQALCNFLLGERDEDTNEG